MSARTKRGRSNGVSEGRDRRRASRAASRDRAPRGYDTPLMHHLTCRPMLVESRGGWYGTEADGRGGSVYVEGWSCDDIMRAKLAEVDLADAMRLVMHADGTLVDPKSEEAAWL